ncbi:hypothetical protein COLO4_13993, partial [Corchorus olitorius]
RTLSSRCSPKEFVALVRSLKSKEQKDVIREMGLGEMSLMKSLNVCTDLCLSLIENFDCTKSSLKICGRDYKFGKDDVVDVFGLPSKGDLIVEGTSLNDRDKLLEMYNIDSAKKIYLQDLLNELPKINANSNEFKAKFLLYAIGCLLCPRSATYVETVWFSYLNEKVLKGDVDWASHVYKMLCSGIEEFQRSVRRQYVSGCIIILQVL